MVEKARTFRQLQRQKQPPPIGQRRLSVRPGRQRQSRSAVGYDWAWMKLAARHKAVNPLCVVCEAAGHTTAVQQTDHIVPFKGLSDPLRLAWDNLQSLCNMHHSKKTAREDGGFGNPKESQHHG